MTYDADRFDAEIILDRSGITSFTFDEMARLLGVHRQTVINSVNQGRLEAPLLRVRISHFGTPRHEWTREQVIGILVSGKHPKPKVLIPCGTEAAAVRHRRLKTPMCDPCRDAQNKANKERYHRNKKKAAA